ncbi:MAG: hypothetical protein ACRD9L_17445 [Bryobacteraceae bacterium]
MRWLEEQVIHLKTGKDWQTAARMEVRLGKLKAIAALCDEGIGVTLMELAIEILSP